MPIVATVLPPTQLTTSRTRDGHPRGFDDYDQTTVTFDDDQGTDLVGPPPILNEHTSAVLAELGFSAGEIAEITAPPPPIA